MARRLLLTSVLWLAATATEGDLVAARDALLRVAAELDHRLETAGLQGMDEVLAVHRRLRAAVGDVGDDDLARIAASVTVVRRWAETVAEQLERLRAIKTRCPE